MTRRDKRVNVSLTPDLKEKLMMLAAINRTTVANLVSQVLSQYVESRSQELTEYSDFLEKLRAKSAEN